MNLVKGRRPSSQEMPGGVDVEKNGSNAKRLSRSSEFAAELRAQNHRLFMIVVLLIIGLVFTSIGWMHADKRFAENVRVAWVKLSPDGRHTIQYDEQQQNQVDYFASTVESKLTEWVEKRYSEKSNSIMDDWGFAHALMSTSLQKRFVAEQAGAKKAAEHAECPKSCRQVEAQVRTIQYLDPIPMPGSLERDQGKLYTALFFVVKTERNSSGEIVDRSNRIVKVKYTFKPKSEIVKKRAALRYNPIGIVIEESENKYDPTPVSATPS